MRFIRILCVVAISITSVACAQLGMDAGPSEAERRAIIDASLADPRRPDTDRADDANRKPGEVIAFAGTKPGDAVADIGATGGYYARVLSGVVGDEGKVYAYNPKRFVENFFKNEDPIAPVAADYSNVESVITPFKEMAFPEPLDSVYLILLYHDTLTPNFGIDAETMNQLVYDALKPGGVFVIVDHKAEDGSGLRDVNTIHRIDGQAVKDGLTAAGFDFIGESDALANPDDDRTKMVFDPSIRRKTDRLIYTFRKPQ